MSDPQHMGSNDTNFAGSGDQDISNTPMVPVSLDEIVVTTEDRPRDAAGKFASTKSDGWNRQSQGRFGPGNKGSKGFDSAPIVRKVQTLRTVMVGGVNAKDVIEVMAALVEKAKTGDVPAIKEFLLRMFGPAEAMDLLLRLDQLEQELIKRASKPETPTLQLTSEQAELDSLLSDLAARERRVG